MKNGALMSEEDLTSLLTNSTRSVVELVRDSLTGYSQMAQDLYQRSRDPSTPIDPWEEMSRWCQRALGDGARLFLALEAMLEDLASTPGTPTSPAPDTPPASNCIKTNVGPVPTGGTVTSADLRRRGDPLPTISSSKVTVRRNRADPTSLDLEIEAGGYPRGLYEGSVAVAGATVASYNIYVDW
jgi:hypothetical protein